jgi:hypothetical protein
LNTPEHYQQQQPEGIILHLVNLSGFSGNTYFAPLPLFDQRFKIRCEFNPQQVFSMVQEKPLLFSWNDGFVSFTLDRLDQFDGIVIKK